MKLLTIIGCPKAGTTALASHLGGRPDMVLGREKEPKYFTDFSERHWTGPATPGFVDTLCRDWCSYVGNFDGLAGDDERWAIDASTDYLWSEGTVERLQRFGEDHTLRLICITRDPLDRAVSEYNQTLQHGWETLSFSQSLDAEAERMAAGWHPLFYHRRRSMIFNDLHRFQELMGERLMIVDYAELARPEMLLRRISAFLNVPHHPASAIAKKNESSLPRHPLAAAAIRSNTLRGIGRLVAPRSLRRRIWQGLHTNSRNLQTVRPQEIDRLRRDLREEIERCLASPLIPTNSWQTALGRRAA